MAEVQKGTFGVKVRSLLCLVFVCESKSGLGIDTERLGYGLEAFPGLLSVGEGKI